MEILQLEKMSKIKCSVNGLNNGWVQLEGTEERISELEDKVIEITQYEHERENRLEEKKNKASGNCETITKEQILCHWNPKRRVKRGWGKKILEKVMVENVPYSLRSALP